MIAVIAGTGTLPIEACKNLLAAQKSFFVVSLFPENNQYELVSATNGTVEIATLPVYKAGAVLDFLKDKATSHVLFIGKVDKGLLLKKLKLDWLAIKLLGSAMTKSDKDLMETLLAELASHNIQVIRQDEVLGGLLVRPGVLTGSLNPDIQKDITIGLDAAISIAHANIGQTVVVKDGMVLAVEAIEGTDQCIKRGIELGKEGVVICKAARLDQNTKFDLPTLGPASLSAFQPGQVKAIAWLSSHTLIAQKDEFIALAQALGITLVSVNLDEKNKGA